MRAGAKNMGLLNRSCDYRVIARITARPGGNAGISALSSASPLLLVPTTTSGWAPRPHWDESPQAQSRAGNGEEGSSRGGKWKVTHTIFTSALRSEGIRHQYSHFPDEENWNPERSSQEPTEGMWWSQIRTPGLWLPNLVIFDFLSSRPKFPAQTLHPAQVSTPSPLGPHCFSLPPLCQALNMLWVLEGSRLWGYKASLSFVSHHLGLSHALCSALKTPHLLPSPSSSPLSADDLVSCFIEQMEISVFSLPQSFLYSGVSTFSLLLALELKMCLFY